MSCHVSFEKINRGFINSQFSFSCLVQPSPNCVYHWLCLSISCSPLHRCRDLFWYFCILPIVQTIATIFFVKLNTSTPEWTYVLFGTRILEMACSLRKLPGFASFRKFYILLISLFRIILRVICMKRIHMSV